MSPFPVGAGFRFSTYGPDFDPGPGYWAEVGRQMAARFPGAAPQAIWIVGRLEGEGSLLSFPVEGSRSALIADSLEDGNEAALTLFDSMGLDVWLQVEPGNAPVEELIHLVLDRYGDHPSVVGFGIDVEWYRSIDKPEGQAVSDREAAEWLAAVRSHKETYQLFLKHWEIEKMPPTLREGLYFVDDSQIFPSVDAMVEEFTAWGRAFAPAPVGFQFGYESDRPWWESYADPPLEIGRRIVDAVPNLAGLYWVDFTVLQVFPPEPPEPVRRDSRLEEQGLEERGLEDPEAENRRLDEPMVGVKTYEPTGSFAQIVAQWRDLGINTGFVSQALLENAEFRNLVRDRGIDLFVITPIFFDPEALEEDPDLYAVTSEGERAKEDWVEFVCPSRQDYRDRRVREIVDLVRRYRPDGVSLDFIRHFVFWEMLRPDTSASDLPNTCFCPHCLAGFSSHTGLEPPAGLPGSSEQAKWILTHHGERWTEWKVHLITTMVTRLVAELEAVDPDLWFNLHAVPWRGSDYEGAMQAIAGQDPEALSSFVDYLSPMTYSFMLRRDPAWIHSVVEDFAASSTARVVPSIQVEAAYRLEESFSSEEFERALREALKPPSHGVVLWSWEALAKDPAKLRIVREVVGEMDGD